MERITAEHPLSQSADILEDNIGKLQHLFPSIFTEGKIDFDALRDLFGDKVETDPEYYRFTWPGKAMAKTEARKSSRGTLRPAPEESVDWDKTENIYIEGDNLEVLKLLQKSYTEQIKMIYIDPPYNRGKDLVYKDDYTDNLSNYKERFNRLDEKGSLVSSSSEVNQEGNAHYHSNWLNMMYPRLILARNLLKKEGVVFISIDNHEVENLKRICNEIFSEENFISQFIWRNGRTSAAIYTNEHEYILAYAKNLSKVEHIKYDGDDTEISDRAIKKISTKNPASTIKFPRGMRFEGEDKTFPRKFGEKETVEVTSGVLEVKGNRLENDVILKAGWVMKDMIESWLEGEEVFDSKGQKVKEFYFKQNGVLQYVKEKGTIHPKTIIEEISTKQGTNEVISLFEFPAFDYPKPTELIKFLLKITKKDDIVLDFFSGSASSAHGIMLQNLQDQGRRKFIQVQLPEEIDAKSEAFKHGYRRLTEIGKERIRRAGKKILNENPTLKGKFDIGFKVFKLDESNIKTWETDPEKLDYNLLTEDVIKEDRSEIDVLYEILLKYGLDLTVPIQDKSIGEQKLYAIGGGALFVCLNDHITPATAQEIINWSDELDAVKPQVVFKDSGFDNSQEKVNTLQLLKTHEITDVWSI